MNEHTRDLAFGNQSCYGLFHGIHNKRNHHASHLPTHFFVMAFFFGLFQAVMPLIGWFCASRFSHLIKDYDHWIAFGLLAFWEDE